MQKTFNFSSKTSTEIKEAVSDVLDKKIASGEYELANNVPTAEILDMDADNMLNLLNQKLAAIPAINTDMPSEAKSLLGKLNGLYLKLYSQINNEASPTAYTALMRAAKNVIPAAPIGMFILSTGVLAMQEYLIRGTSKPLQKIMNSNRTRGFALMGWLLSNAITMGLSYWISQQPGPKIPPSAWTTIQEIKVVEAQLKQYGVVL